MRGKIKRGLPLERTISLIGISTPQLGGPNKSHEAYANEARDFLRKKYNTLQIEFYIEQKPHYGRVISNGEDLTE